VVRSSICPAFRIGCDTRKRDVDYDLLRRMVGEFRKMAPYLLGDFYPLTPYSLENNVWIAWQFDRPEEGGGVVQAFRRPESPDDSVRLKLRGLDPGARYALTDLDTNTAQEIVGRELMDEGLPIRTSARPASAVVIYKKAK
jgi:alpha-galactosidase